MANRIVLKRSSVANRVPLATDLVAGELAVNLTDKLLYTKDAAGNVITVGDGGGGGGSGTVTGVTATAPVVSSGGTAPVISMAAANTSTPGYLTAADWNTFNSKQAALGYTPYNATNPSGYISSITSANVTTALGYTPYNATNPNGYISSITSANVTTALGFTPYNSSNPSGYITSSALSSYLPLSGGTLSGPLAFSNTAGNKLTFYYSGADKYGIDVQSSELRIFSGAGGDATGGITFGKHDGTTFTEWMRVRNNGTILANGNQVLHAGNYTSYSPSLTGSGASGTWGINVTGNASNITAYTINQSLGTGNGPTFAEVYSNGWFRNTGAQGLYNGTHGHHFYATSSQYFNLAGNDGTVCGLILRTGGHQGSIRGYLYANSSNNIGFLTQDGNWQMRCNNSEVELYDTSYANDFRTYITYDRDNTAYYLNPAADGISAALARSVYIGDVNSDGILWDYGNGAYRPGMVLRGSYPHIDLVGTTTNGNHGSTLRFMAYDSGGSGAYKHWVIGTGSNNAVFLDFGCATNASNPHQGISGYGGTTTMRMTTNGYVGIGGNWGPYGSVANPSYAAHVQGTGYASSDFRAPQFFDANDTAYYLDPNGTSELSTLTAATRTRWDMPRRTFNRQAYTAGTGYWTGTRGWGGTFNWNQAWGYGFGGFDIWGENTQHPQGNGYIHAQGICSGLHHVNDDGTSAYGFQLVGGTNASDRLWYRGAWGNTGNNWREIPMFDVNSGNGSWMWFAGWYDNNNSGYYVDPNGTSRMGTINADALNSYGNVIAYYSDERLKTIKGPILNAVEKLSQIDGFYYTGNDTAKSFGYDTEKLQLGVSAQRVESVFPELIERAPCSDKVNGAEYKTLDYSKLVPVLIEAIKEQQTQIEELRNLINSR
jgi:hypothetical protein